MGEPAQEEEKLLKANYKGVLHIAEKKLNCAVLEDGTRVMSTGALFAFCSLFSPFTNNLIRFIIEVSRTKREELI